MTYGAGGTTRSSTVELTKWIKRDLGIEARLTSRAWASPPSACVEILGRSHESGVENVLALRGDPPRGRRVAARTPAGSTIRSS